MSRPRRPDRVGELAELTFTLQKSRRTLDHDSLPADAGARRRDGHGTGRRSGEATV
jgi:hypothetical protein